ncbi:transposase, partial [Aequitasia blattaphilus]|uniref:transposase family protein n=1 Tax=Aequitasia blattaphilus TaxID=2949332 RepID=UPI003D2003C1
MHSNSISKLLNLKEVTVKKLEQSDSMINVYLETRPKEHVCPCCGLSTSKIHDYRAQKIKHFPINHKEVILILRK